MILDEATAHLDPLIEAEVRQDIQRLMADRTTLLITHRLTGLETVDEILVMQAGRVIERGRHYQLMQVKGLYYHLWTLQQQAITEYPGEPLPPSDGCHTDNVTHATSEFNSHGVR